MLLQLMYPLEYLNACYMEIKIFFILENILKNIFYIKIFFLFLNIYCFLFPQIHYTQKEHNILFPLNLICLHIILEL